MRVIIMLHATFQPCILFWLTISSNTFLKVNIFRLWIDYEKWVWLSHLIRFALSVIVVCSVGLTLVNKLTKRRTNVNLVCNQLLDEITCACTNYQKAVQWWLLEITYMVQLPPVYTNLAKSRTNAKFVWNHLLERNHLCVCKLVKSSTNVKFM